VPGSSVSSFSPSETGRVFTFSSFFSISLVLVPAFSISFLADSIFFFVAARTSPNFPNSVLTKLSMFIPAWPIRKKCRPGIFFPLDGTVSHQAIRNG
jgi:hypothetical protein